MGGSDDGTVINHPFKKMRPGVVAVLMDFKDRTGAGIYLPPSGRLTPDTGRVICSGVDELPEGCRVITKNHDSTNEFAAGAWLRHKDTEWVPDGRVVKLFGVSDQWDANLLARIDDEIEPVSDWCLIRRKAKSQGAILTLDPGFHKVGTLEGASPETIKRLRQDGWDGSEIAFSGEPIDFDGHDDALCLVRLSQIQVGVAA